MELIKVKEMLQVMEMRGDDGQPIPFDFRFITCNQKAGTGGKRISCTNVVLVGSAESKGHIKDQNRFKNFTRNFRSINNDEIRQFHPLLVESFNGMRVVL